MIENCWETPSRSVKGFREEGKERERTIRVSASATASVRLRILNPSTCAMQSSYAQVANSDNDAIYNNSN